jgi:hypothetical protein
MPISMTVQLATTEDPARPVSLGLLGIETFE